MSGRSLGSRIAAFGGLSLLASVSPLLVLPFVARSVPEQVWGTLLTCQAVGQLLGLVLLSGWGIDGQARAASMADEQARRALYITSFTQRIKVAAWVLPLAVVSGLVLSRGHSEATHVLMSVAGTWSGFGISWYAIGSGSAGWVARYDALPRIVASALSAAAIALSVGVWIYPLLVITLMSGAILAFNRLHAGSWVPQERRGPEVKRPGSFVPGTLSLVGAAYAGAPLPMSQALQIGSAPQLASADRLYRYALFSVTSLANALQQWVLSREGATLAKARRTAVLMHVALGFTGGLGFALLAEPVGALLFSRSVAPDASVAAGYGVAFFCVSSATPLTRNFLVPMGRTQTVLALAVTSALIGIVGMSIGGSVWGATGLSWALALADAVFLVGAAVATRARSN